MSRESEVVSSFYPGAVTVANFLRTLAWVVVIADALGGFILGVGFFANSIGGAAILTGLVFAFAGLFVGLLSASGMFTTAYVLLLLDKVELNTRVIASKKTLEA